MRASVSGSARMGRPFGCHSPLTPGAALNRGVPSGQCGVGGTGAAGRRSWADKDIGVDSKAVRRTLSTRAAMKRRTFDLLEVKSVHNRLALAGRCAESFTGACHRHVFCIHVATAILCQTSFDDDLVSNLHRLLRPSGTPEAVRAAHFKTPVFSGAVFSLDVDVEPHMRIRPVD